MSAGSPGGGDIRITVVIPARDAVATIEEAVRGVLAQRGAPAFRLVVVDNASTDGTGDQARAAGAEVVRLEGRDGGPGRARNAGVSAATGSHVAFTDADCRPTPGWLAALWGAAGGAARTDPADVLRGPAGADGSGAAARAEIVAGPVRADPRAARGTWDRTLEYPGPTPLWATANVLIARSTLDGAGGFDDWVAGPAEAPRRPFGEDTVLAWRAIRAGARTAWAPDAIVDHAVVPRGARGHVAQQRDLRHMPGLVAQVPELRRELLLGRVALNPATATASLALAGVAAALVTRRLAPLAAVAPWAGRQVLAARAVGPRIAVVRAAAELVGAASLAEGSVRHRTLVV